MPSIWTSEPHYIPAYTGYCPQLKFRIGESYGHLTHKLLVDPQVAHSENLVLSDGKKKRCEKKEPTTPYIDQSQRIENDIVFRDPMVPSYKGFFPKVRDKFGNRYAASASEALVEFKKEHLMRQVDYEKMLDKIAQQNHKRVDERFKNSRKTPKVDYKIPLPMVRPEIPSTPQNPNECLPKPPSSSAITRIPILFNCPPDSYQVKGSTGNRCLFQYPEFGQMSKIETAATLTDFTNNYNFRQAAEWTPVPFYHSSLVADQGGAEIYPRTTGLLPNYQGHVPGLKHSYGKTFGAESINAKRNLRTGICSH